MRISIDTSGCLLAVNKALDFVLGPQNREASFGWLFCFWRHARTRRKLAAILLVAVPRPMTLADAKLSEALPNAAEPTKHSRNDIETGA